MDTPICDFVREYAQKDPLRGHMPGHKGHGPLGAEGWDITEIPSADVLYHPTGIIRQSEQNAAALFGAGRTLYSAEGSSLAIRAMVYLAALYARQTGRRPVIAAGRNAHQTFVTAAALLDVEVAWLYGGKGDLLRCDLSADGLERALNALPAPPAAVYITSPDYLGNVADIAALAAVCRRRDIPLMVDNAHGAYLRFLPDDRHPLSLGADLCCDSAHKTLPVLTGGGYLHIAPGAPVFFAEQAEAAMAVFASTSPSYLILQSLDAANAYLDGGYRNDLAAFADAVDQTKARLAADWRLVGDEKLKITLAPKSRGYTGRELADRLAEKGIVAEFADPDHLVLMLTPETGNAALSRLEATLKAVPPKPPIADAPPPLPRLKQATSAHAALTAPAEEIAAANAAGRILAAPTVSCPPAVPVAVCGEEIDDDALRVFAYYGISRCRVVKE
ncbi:MAG: amino acid decarboxylase [Acutalibacteraceae bacterium]